MNKLYSENLNMAMWMVMYMCAMYIRFVVFNSDKLRLDDYSICSF